MMHKTTVCARGVERQDQGFHAEGFEKTHANRPSPTGGESQKAMQSEVMGIPANLQLKP